MSRRPMLSALAAWVDRPDGGLDRRRILVAVVIGYIVFLTTYIPINNWSVGRPAHSLYLPGEEQLPFIPEFEFIYILVYPLPLLLVASLPNARRLQQAAVAFALILSVAYATYIVFPVTLTRPAFTADTPAKWLLAWEYQDPAYNNFPSLHVALAWLVYFSCRTGRHRSYWLAGIAAAISVSTLFVKQHYLADVVYGLLLAWAAWTWSRRLVPKALATMEKS